MKTYVGAKIISAKKATLRESRLLRGMKLENLPHEDMEGYHVVYPRFSDMQEDYTSWSPKDVFEQCYREVSIFEKEHCYVILPTYEGVIDKQ